MARKKQRTCSGSDPILDERRSLLDLPEELLLRIHVLSQSPSLPNLSRHFRSIFTFPHLSHRIDYLFARHPPSPTTLTKAARYGICNMEVLNRMEAELLQREILKTEIAADNDQERKDGEEVDSPPLGEGRFGTGRCKEIPRRLFRTLGTVPGSRWKGTKLETLGSEIDMPLLMHLLVKHQSSPNTNSGYPLARAVLSGDRDLVTLLLRNGADPTLKDAAAIMIAIGRGDENLVKLLIEGPRSDSPPEVPPRPSSTPTLPPQEPNPRDASSTAASHQTTPTTLVNVRKRKSLTEEEPSPSPPKRRKVDDLVKVTSSMMEAAVQHKRWKIVQFFQEKGAVPSMKAMQMLQQSGLFA